jgi:hypothetical protein
MASVKDLFLGRRLWILKKQDGESAGTGIAQVCCRKIRILSLAEF